MRRQFRAKLLIIGVVLLHAICGCAQHAATQSTSADDLDKIMDWWNGDYNNDQQISRLEADGKPVWRADDSGEGGHIQVTSHYRRIALPEFAENVLYVEETKHGDPNNIFRQRIYTLTIDSNLDKVRVKLWNFNDKKKYVGAWRDLSRVSNLSPGAMSPLPDNCDLLVQRIKNKYHMAMQDKACAFGDRYFNYQVLLGQDSFWFRDKIVSLENDKVLVMSGDFTYHELNKSK